MKNVKGGNFCFQFFLKRIFGVCFVLSLCSVFFLSNFVNYCLAVDNIYISEVAWMGGVDSGNDEWVEIYNKSGEDVDLSGWIMLARDGSPRIELEGVVREGECYLMERTDDDSVSGVKADLIYSGSLSNSGEWLELFDGDGNLIDSVNASDGWTGGDNESKRTMEFCGGVWRSGENAGGSPGVVNNCEGGGFDNVSGSGGVNDDSSGNGGRSIVEKNKKEKSILSDVVISEILPNPVGSDFEDEFIEIYNQGEDSLNLGGLIIEDSEGFKYEFERDGRILGKDYFVVYRKESGIAMNNSGDEICIYLASDKKEKECVEYEDAREGESYVLSSISELKSRQDNLKDGFILSEFVDKWEWAQEVSTGEKNIIYVKNNLPIVDYEVSGDFFVGENIYFDASDSMDFETEELKFFWDFGDGIRSEMSSLHHVYLREGEYEVKLIVGDEVDKVEKIKNVVIESRANDFVSSILMSGNEEFKAGDPPKVDLWEGGNVEDDNRKNNKLSIVNILPNPEGRDDEQEMIGVMNRGEDEICLSGVRIGNGKNFYEIEDGIRIKSGEVGILDSGEINFVLKNSGGIVSLVSENERLLDKVNYGKAREGEVFVYDEDDGWSWQKLDRSVNSEMGNNLKSGIRSVNKSKEIGKKNEEGLVVLSSEGGCDGENNNQGENMKRGNSSKVDLWNDVGENYLMDCEAGKKVSVRGVVMILPGGFGSQYFYIDYSGRAVQVYNYKKNFAELRVGDEVVVSGEISKLKNVCRIKIKNLGDVKVVGSGVDLDFLELGIFEFDEKRLNGFYKIEGEVVEKKGSSVFIDDGEAEIELYLKEGIGIKKSDFKLRDKYFVEGIYMVVSSRSVLVPLSFEEVEVAGSESDAKVFEMDLEGVSEFEKVKKYLVSIGLFLVGVVGWFVFKSKI